MLADEVMIKEVICVEGTISLFQLEEIFFNKNISGAPVVDDENNLIGIVSKTDLICHELELELETIIHSFASVLPDEAAELREISEKITQRSTFVTVQDIMTKDVLTIEKDVPVKEIASLMMKNRIHRLVVTEKGKVVGLISSMDLLPLIS